MSEEFNTKESFEKCSPLVHEWLADTKNKNLSLYDLMLVTSFVLGWTFDAIKTHVDTSLNAEDFAEECRKMTLSACDRSTYGGEN